MRTNDPEHGLDAYIAYHESRSIVINLINVFEQLMGPMSFVNFEEYVEHMIDGN